MIGSRTIHAQGTSPELREVLDQCVTAMAQLDADLNFQWLNPALAELLGAGILRWQGASLEVIEPGSSAIVEAARRALVDQQVVVLRQVEIRSSVDSELTQNHDQIGRAHV